MLMAEPLIREAKKEADGAVGMVRVHLDADRISVSDSLVMTVEVTIPAGYKAELPAFADYGFALDFSDRSSRFRPTDIGEESTQLQADGSSIKRQSYTLEPWLSGDYSIPPLMVGFFKDKETDEASKELAALIGPIPDFSVITNAARIAVTPLADGRKELVDIYQQSDYKQHVLKKRVRRQEDKSDEELKREDVQHQQAVLALAQRQFPWWLVWTLGSAGLVLVAVWLFGRKRIAALLSPKRLPAHEIAYAALAELHSKQLPENGKVKEFYYELSYILREYVGNRFLVYAINQSTEEFFQVLVDDNPFDREAEDLLRDFAELADTVKYSLHRPGAKVADKSYQVARSFVDSSKQLDKEASS
jgi:hypothetical protein